MKRKPIFEIMFGITREQLNMVTSTINQEAKAGDVTNVKIGCISGMEPGEVLVTYDKDQSPYKFVISPNGFRTSQTAAYIGRRK